MKKYYILLKKIINSLDCKTKKFLKHSISLGFAWFFIELVFVYVLQVFLLSLNILDTSKLQLPSWFPVGITSSTVLLILFGILRSFVNFAKNYSSTLAQQSFVRVCRDELVEGGLDSKIFNTSSEFLTLMSDRVNQSGQFIQFLSLGIVSFSAVILFFVFGFHLAPREMIFSLSLTLILMLPVKKVTYKIQHFGESLNVKWSEINDDVIISKKNMFFLEIYDLVKFKKQEIKDNLIGYEIKYGEYAKIASLLSSLPLFVGICVLSLCSYLSVEYFNTSPIKVLSFFYIFLRMTQGLSEINSIYAALKLNYPAYKEVQIALERLRNFREMQSASLVDNTSIKLTIIEKQVEMRVKSVGFAYPDGDYLYKNLTFELKTGDILVIKGPSGAGKSTLLKLLLGLEAPTNGKITLNDVDVKNLDQEWRAKLGYVGADPYLIKGTIRDNLNFGNLGASELKDEDYRYALSLAGLAGDFQQIKVELDTVIAEASFLSTGQRQRLSIARAFVRKPKIVIFDEATANLDTGSEEQIVQNIKLLSGEILTIIVTHKNTFDKIGTHFINIGS